MLPRDREVLQNTLDLLIAFIVNIEQIPMMLFYLKYLWM